MTCDQLIKKIIPNSVRNFLHLFYACFGAVRYGRPSERLLVVGVTGTSGKSSTIYLLKHILEAAGTRVGALSTVEFCVAGACRLNDQKMTMLGKMQIQKYLREMIGAGCDVALIETTSEGYLQHRHRFINYDTIVLTNLYPEHIEAHGGFENYKAAKLGIFRYVAGCRRKELKGKRVPKTAIVNGESEYADEFFAFPFDENSRFHPKDFPKRNHACATAVARTLGVPDETIWVALEQAPGVPGRMEHIEEAKRRGFDVIVDYAFEPVAMAALYEEAARLRPKRIIHVFGSTGGGRDKARRFTVGKFVGERATTCIVTNEDPYDDDPMAIIADVARAVRDAGKIDGENLFIIPDRRAAMRAALSLARAGDLVLVTGKGSEQGIVEKGKIIPWDDRKVIKEELAYVYPE